MPNMVQNFNNTQGEQEYAPNGIKRSKNKNKTYFGIEN